MTTIFIILFILTGLLAGFSSGILGIGGGTVVVPLLYWIFLSQKLPHSMHMAIATSLAIMIFTTLSSSISHALKKAIQWRSFIFLSIGALFGSTVGPYVARFISSEILKIVFAFLEIAVAFYLLFYKKPQTTPHNNKISFYKDFTMIIIGLVFGFISTILGLGGGFLLVPLLILLHMETKKAIATSAAYAFVLSLIGTFSYFFFSRETHHPFGLINIQATIATALASLVTAPLGAHLCHRIQENLLKKIFAVFLFIVAILMLV